MSKKLYKGSAVPQLPVVNRGSYVISDDEKLRSSEEHHIEGQYYKCFGKFECFFCGMDSLLDSGRSDLAGKILTVIDGAITDPRQNKAVKDLISQAVWNTFFNATDGPGDTNLSQRSRMILANAIRHEAGVRERDHYNALCDRIGGKEE